MKVVKLYFFLIIVIMGLFMFSCNKPVGKSNKLQIDNTAYYKKKYNLTYVHYKSPKHSLKLKALDFIIKNLPYQYHYSSSTLAKYDSVLLANQNREEDYLKNTLDSLTIIYGSNINLVSDDRRITNAYLINNIDAAFKSWEYKWGGTKLSFTDFCEYILPYKLENEKPEYWRDILINQFQIDTTSVSLFNASDSINKKIKPFTVTMSYDYPIDIGYKLINLLGTGSCASSTKLVAYPMRALGIPVVIDYAFWGNRSLKHFWNAVIYKNKPYPFDALESKIGFYKIQFTSIDKIKRKPPKIYRKMFSVQQNSLAYQNLTKEVIPNNLTNLRVKDVTAEYIPVSNVSLTYNTSCKNKFSYLCTFNNHDWIPIWWGKNINDKVEFKNMGRDMVYLPCLLANSTATYIGNPFILNVLGETVELKANLNLTTTIPINKKYPDDLSNEIEIGDEYELLYWQDGWQSLGKQIAAKKTIYFKNAPDNALFWIRDLTKGKQERIFTYKNNKVQWW